MTGPDRFGIPPRDTPSRSASPGYFGINTSGYDVKPQLDYRTEVFQLDEALLQKVLALSAGARLTDSEEAAGNALGKRVRDWVQLMTDGQGTYSPLSKKTTAASRYSCAPRRRAYSTETAWRCSAAAQTSNALSRPARERSAGRLRRAGRLCAGHRQPVRRGRSLGARRGGALERVEGGRARVSGALAHTAAAMSLDFRRATPALVMSFQAFARDPFRSMPRQASSTTAASKPSLRASSADQATQKSVASPQK
jgi:hypothetical protein